MSKQTLGELLYNGLQYDKSWGIYALDTGVDSPARIGQTQFESGGVLDGMFFIIDGETLGNAIAELTEGEPEVMEYVSYQQLLELLMDNEWIVAAEEA